MIIVGLPATGGAGLTDYLFLLRRLLHDPSDRMFPVEDKIKYINFARERLARDTACCRLMQPDLTLLQGVEQYSLPSFLPYGPRTVDVLGIAAMWGNLRVQLSSVPFQRLDTWLRTWNTIRQRPAYFSRYGNGVIYVAPIPDQDYTADFDTVVTPDDLVDEDSTEQIPIPFQTAVPFYAAYLAKMYEQSIGESDRMLQQYEMHRRNAQATWRRRMFTSPYQG